MEPIFPELSADFDISEHISDLRSYDAIDKKMQLKGVADLTLQHYKTCLREEHYTAFDPDLKWALKTLHKLKGVTDNINDVKQGNNPYCFFTINLKPEKATEEYLEEFSDFFKKFIENCALIKGQYIYIYSLEQRSEGDEPMNGLHVHILFEKRDVPPSRLKIAFTRKFFDKWVGTHAAIDFRFIGSTYANQIKYIMGIKATPKMAKVRHDIVFPYSGSIALPNLLVQLCRRLVVSMFGCERRRHSTLREHSVNIQ
jgi:hypothetical protein